MYRRLTMDPENEIELWTRNGPCRIQLLSGDITQLPVSEKVDIIMVSAFPGDYAPLSGTVIGALDKNLGISVRSLAYDKEMDLRHLFSCWVSKPIDKENSPFKKLLCFERRASLSVVEQVSQMFRVFVPVFNNQDSTVITPLLASGHQGQSELQICETMVKAGAHWINAGLPLRCLKIVLYGGVDVKIADTFQALKKKLLAKNLKLRTQITKKAYDVYVSFHPEDKTKYVGHIVSSLKKEESKIKLFATIIEYDHDSVWQKDIFDAMVSSKRIIVVLTAMFLKSPECLEQYNMAMCCSKLMGGHILAPFYLESINSLPSYMSLVQWIDCRERKEGDNTMLKIEQACSTVLSSITEKHEHLEVSAGGSTNQAKTDKFKYDVFISYSHKNPREAEMLLKIFGEVDDTVKVFYDRSALTTGSNWQEMLYQCMGLCKCAIALLSPTYLTSTVCMEEYNLALARFLSQGEGMQFLPVWIERSDTVPIQISAVTIMDAVDDFDFKAHQIAKHVSKFLKDPENMTESTLFPKVPSNYCQSGVELSEAETVVEKLLSMHRSSHVPEQYRFSVKNQEKRDFERVKPLVIPKTEKRLESSPTDIVVSFSNDSNYLATTFCTLLEQKCPHLKISIHSEQNLERMAALDTASVMVMFISREFLLTDSQMHELHLALTRQRLCEKKVLYLLKTTPLKDIHPFFPRILRYDIATTDSVWEQFEKEFLKGRSQSDNRKMVTLGRSHKAGVARFFSCKFSEYFALTKASDDVIELALDLKVNAKSHGPLLLNLVTLEMEISGKTEFRDVTQDSTVTNSNSHNITVGEVKSEVKGEKTEEKFSENDVQKDTDKSKDNDQITGIKYDKNSNTSSLTSVSHDENLLPKSNSKGNAMLEQMAVKNEDNSKVEEDKVIGNVSESNNTEIKVSNAETKVDQKQSNSRDEKNSVVDDKNKVVHVHETGMEEQNQSVTVMESTESYKTQKDIKRRTGSNVTTQQKTSKSCILL